MSGFESKLGLFSDLTNFVLLFLTVNSKACSQTSQFFVEYSVCNQWGSTSPTEEFTYLGLSDFSLLNTERVLGLIQYHIHKKSCRNFSLSLFKSSNCSEIWQASLQHWLFFLESGTSISTSNHMGLRLCDIFQRYLLSDIKTGLRQQHTKLKWSHGSNLLLQPSKTCINNR